MTDKTEEKTNFMYLHCKKCVEEEKPQNTEIFTDGEEIFIMCQTHGEPIIIVPAPEYLKGASCEGCDDISHLH